MVLRGSAEAGYQMPHVSPQGDAVVQRDEKDRLKPRLVIADDEADIRRLIVFLLRSYDLCEAQNGKRALELIREMQPDLVLLDVMMPEMTGLEVLDAVHRDPLTASIPIILLSAKGQVSEIEQGLQSGATRYLVKPFEPQALRTCVAEVLQEYPSQPVANR